MSAPPVRCGVGLFGVGLRRGFRGVWVWVWMWVWMWMWVCWIDRVWCWGLGWGLRCGVGGWMWGVLYCIAVVWRWVPWIVNVCACV
jgi:hypothetical protein